MDAATLSLDRIKRGDGFDVVPNVAVFDEHDEEVTEEDYAKEPAFIVTDKRTGKLVRRFDRKALEELRRICQGREEETASLSPIGPGHTLPGRPDSEQPPTWGVARNWRVEPIGPRGDKLGLVVDYHVRNTVRIKDEDGTVREVSGREALNMTRPSVELWLRDRMIDRIALLKGKTPRRDLGILLTHNRRGLCLRYSMEDSDVGDPTEVPPNADMPSPEEAMQYDKIIKYAMPQIVEMCTKMCTTMMAQHQQAQQQPPMPGAPPVPGGAPVPGAPPAAPTDPMQAQAGAPALPSPTNGALPGAGPAKEPPFDKPDKKPSKPDDDEEPEKMSKEHEERLARYEKELVDLRQDKRLSDQRLEKLEAENNAAKRENTLTRYEMELVAKAREGYNFDVKEELAIVADPMETGKPDSTPMSREQFDRHLKRLEKYERDPSTYPMLSIDQPRKAELDDRNADQAIQYAREHRCSFDEACKAILGTKP